jgi:hypothetical protein
VTPHPPPCGPPSPLRRGKLFFGGVRAPRSSHPSPRGEGGPRHALSPAGAGRMRGHFHPHDHQLPATHNRRSGPAASDWELRSARGSFWQIHYSATWIGCVDDLGCAERTSPQLGLR